MYTAGYPYHDDLRTMDPRSRLPDDPYAQPPPSWQMLQHPPYPDLSVPIPPPQGSSAHVPSPMSTPSNAGGNSPVDYFGMHNMGSSQQEQWMMQQAQHTHSMSGPYVEGGYLPVKAETNHYPAALSADYGHILQDPSQFNIDQFTQLSSGANGSSTAGGPDRTKRGRQGAAKRTGACARCRRLKMKCTFNQTDDEVCSRCVAGGYECVFPGRKPRAPGVRMVLRQQIREKDAQIDNLLNRVNPGPTMATPLTLVPARLPFTQKERAEYRDVLTYLERAAQQAGQRFMGDGRTKFDISALEDVMSEDESDSGEEMAEGLTSPKRGTSPRNEQSRMESILEVAAPTGMMAAAALQNWGANAKSLPDSASESSGSKDSADAGVAGEMYFLPGPQANLQLRRLIVERQSPPDILLSGLITSDDVTALFEIHYKWINPIIPILDENIHSPASVLARCPFLFTIICTVASRYYKEKPQIHGMAIHFAKAAAANAVIDGWKTVEMCQAFALWSVYNPPARRWEEDRAWCYTGIAFRLATELNLSRIPDKFADERAARESHNRTRMWLMSFIMDRCLSIQSGKAWMVQEDSTLRDVASWLRNHKYHNQCDGYLTSLTELLIIMSRFVGTVNPAFGTSSVESIDDIDFAALYRAYDDELMAWKNNIDDRHKGEKSSSEPAIVMEITLVNCVYYYCRLVICCCGMQLMSKQKTLKPSELFAGCVQAATSLVKLMIEGFVPSGFVPYFPELVYVHSAFAAVVLLKCLRPEYNAFLDIQQEERIIDLVKRLFETWTSDKFSLDERHNTQLYARFVKQLMEPHIARLAQKKRAAGQSTTEVKTEQIPISPTSVSDSSTSQTMYPEPDPTLSLGDIYSPDVDVSKAAAQLSASGMLPDPGVSWEQLFASSESGGFLNGPMGGGDVTGMMGDECLAAMMGLGDGAWFLQT
ncbi:hypothetical protein OH76DRAFT_1482841 [Lentinus brumalis]|uniref:Zn(2)-C6 fungal-type domain-containing protein n=1 Tax=Lentinus brumalis TaxID=2498619 RepID=A0A371DB21_9APHY|nr:hypothetical protein OH76DRAFT_1482841 [Polyporus brumalis]